jgi:hypothetical protein
MGGPISASSSGPLPRPLPPPSLSAALGLGSLRNGGAPSYYDGGAFALGNTEESLRALNLGLAERGSHAPRPTARCKVVRSNSTSKR